jgi:hypothetical protein
VPGALLPQAVSEVPGAEALGVPGVAPGVLGVAPGVRQAGALLEVSETSPEA